MTMPLADLLLRRKELDAKVKQLHTIKEANVYYPQFQERIKRDENFDDIKGRYPILEAHQVLAEYDHYARCLRIIDGAIQRANWEHKVDIEDRVMRDWFEQKKFVEAQ